MVHLPTFRLWQHGTEEWKMMARSITASRIHERWCNSHDNPNIKGVILQGRIEQKLDWHLICRAQLLWPNPGYGWGTGVCFSKSFRNRMAWRTTRIIGIDEHKCTHTLGYQLIEDGRNTTEEEQLEEHIIFWVVDAKISMSSKAQHFFRTTHADR